MKKFVSSILFTLLAVSMVAGGAQAATIFKKDGFTYKLKGDLQIQLRQDVGDDQDMDVEYDDLEIKNAVSYEINDNMKAFGELDFGFKNDADKDGGDPHLEEAYVGLSFQNFSILVGKTDNAADEFGVFSGYESVISEDAFDDVGATSGDDLIRADIEMETVTVVISHEIQAESEDLGEATSTEIFVGAEFAGVELGAAYQTFEADVDADSVDTWGVSVAYDAEVVWVGADYSVADYDDELTEWNVAVEVPVAETTTIGAGYSYIDQDNTDEISAWYANVTHKLHKKVKVFAEIADSDEDDHDMGYLAGLQVKF